MSNDSISLREPIEDLRKIENDPSSIRLMRNPTEDLQLLAVNDDPHSIEYIKHPLQIVMETVIKLDPTTIKHFWRTATPAIRQMAIERDGSVIQYIKDATIEEQKISMRQDASHWDLISNKNWQTNVWWMILWYKFFV